MKKNDILKQRFGHTAFREGQAELIDAILAGRDVFGVMPTGAGKSVCYQVPALMLEGITLVVSPLISLMKDQVNALVQSGISAAYLNSSLAAPQYDEVLRRAANGEYKILYVAPERLVAAGFLRFAEAATISMATVDEAHCVSQWGQDFRPGYLKIVEFIERLSRRPVVSAFTATATEEVREDVIRILRLRNPFVVTTGFDRKNLFFGVRKPNDKFTETQKIVRQNRNRSGIVYCAARKTVEEVCDRLNGSGVSATRYHAGLDDDERRKNQDDFLNDRKTVMVATNAFGMGIDKSDVAFVVHYNMPKNIESYYQEAGRAGRDGEPAECILLYGGRDVRTNLYLIDNNRDADEDLPPEVRAAVREKDRERLRAMTAYCATTGCLREYLLRYFGETAPHFCGRCSNCDTEFETVDVTTESQKIVSCVYRVLQRNRAFGKKMIVDILHGGRNEKVLQSGMDSLSTYGIMADAPVRRIREILDFLVDSDFLALSADEYPVVTPSLRSGEVIREKRTIEMKVPARRASVEVRRTEAPGGGDDELFESLRALRARLASEAHVPAYVVFPDAALRDMCRKLPLTSDAFLEVAGVGEAKMERYGESFTGVIREHVSRNAAPSGRNGAADPEEPE